ncbi:MAG: hypothetical protein KBT28_10760 [Bacteroidales bacterium]|nr:hypothetical protein [Candidatus Colimorpha merdihippi]
MANQSIFTDSVNSLMKGSKPLDLVGFMQILFDKYERAYIAKFSETYVDRYLNWNPIQMGLTAEALMGQYHFRIMAAVIDSDSGTPLRSTTGFKAWTEGIPRIGHKYAMEAYKLRQLYSMLESIRIADTAKVNQLQQTIFNNVKNAYLGCKDTLDFILLQALSNDGIASFDPDTNNPNGVKCVLNYDMPAENKKTATVEWNASNSASGSIDIIMELQDIVHEMEDKGIDVAEILASPELYTFILRDKTVRKAVLGNDKSSAMVTNDQLSATLSAYGIPKITQIRKRTAIEKDGKRSLLNPWNGDNLVFLPAGKIGEVQPAVEDSDLIPEANVSYINSAEGIKVSLWSTGDSTGQTPTEYTQAAGRVLPILTEINAIYRYKVKNIS